MFDLGDVVPLSVEVRDANGQLADAGNMRLEVTLPDQTQDVTDPVAPTSTGVYDHDFQTILAGRHLARWVATGANAGAFVDAFDVRQALPPYIVSLAAARDHLNITGTGGDEELRGFVEAATRVVEDHPDFGVGPVAIRTVIERHHARCTDRLLLFRPPVIDVTTMAAVLDAGTSYDPLDLDVDGDSGVVLRRNGLAFDGGPWDVTYTAGRQFVNANWRLAALEVVRHLWETQRGGTLALGPGGSEEATWVPGFAFSIPRRALELLEPDKHGPLVA